VQPATKWPNWCVTSNPITTTQTDNNVTAEAKVRGVGRWDFTAPKVGQSIERMGQKNASMKKL
jgi:hypothetical protein